MLLRPLIRASVLVRGCCAIGLLALAAAASAEQFVLADAVVRQTENFQRLRGPGGGKAPDRIHHGEVPTNWLAPVDYVNGTWHVRIEVIEKNNRAPVRWDVNFTNGNGSRNYLRLRRTPPVTEPGVYEFSGSLMGDSSIVWNTQPGDWDWTDAFRTVWIDGLPMGGRGDPYPMTLRVTFTIVSAGGRYNPHGVYGELDHQALEHIDPVARHLAEGDVAAAYRLAESLVDHQRADVAAEARSVVEGLRAYADARRDELADMKASAPLYALAQLEQLAKQFERTAIGAELVALGRTWSSEPAMEAERRSYPLYQRIDDAVTRLRRYGTADDPRFQQRHQDQLRAIVALMARLEREHPDTVNCRNAWALIDSLKIPRSAVEALVGRQDVARGSAP